MKLRDIPPLYRSVWSVYEALRQLGFADEQVTYISGRTLLSDGSVSANDWLSVVLTASEQTFTVVVGPLDRSFDDARAMLESVRMAIGERRVNEQDLLRMWNESKMASLEYFTRFAEAIVAFGIDIPELKKYQN
jgi:hypothetical protein